MNQGVMILIMMMFDAYPHYVMLVQDFRQSEDTALEQRVLIHR